MLTVLVHKSYNTIQSKKCDPTQIFFVLLIYQQTKSSRDAVKLAHIIDTQLYLFCENLVLVSFILILSYEAEFYKPTILKFHPPFLQDYSICSNARLISTQFLLQLLTQMNGACIMVSSVGV